MQIFVYFSLLYLQVWKIYYTFAISKINKTYITKRTDMKTLILILITFICGGIFFANAALYPENVNSAQIFGGLSVIFFFYAVVTSLIIYIEYKERRK